MDRNKQITETMKQMTGSLSARRAWIEIADVSGVQGYRTLVALRKESVDRNAYGRINDISRLVALRKESVDRNVRRSP